MKYFWTKIRVASQCVAKESEREKVAQIRRSLGIIPIGELSPEGQVGRKTKKNTAEIIQDF